MHLGKLGLGLVFAFLIGCEDSTAVLNAPDSAVYPDGSLQATVGETHLLEAYTYRWGGFNDGQSFDCGEDNATVTSSDSTVVTVGTTGFRDTDDTESGDDVSALTALYHAVGPGSATVTATCDGMTASVTIEVKPCGT